MYFINQHEKPASSISADTPEGRIFIFDTEEEDYFLQMCIAWDKITTTFYKIQLGESIYNIPSGTFILCGCDGGSQDWIDVEELVWRPIEVILINHNYRSWDFVQPKFIDMYEGFCYFPMTKSPIPVTDAMGLKNIIVSSSDQYRKLKDKDYDIFFV